MLGIFGDKALHPLVDGKEAKRILSGLTGGGDAAGVDEAAGWFESLAGLEDIGTALRYRRGIEVAAATLPAARRLTRDYLSGTFATRMQEQATWQLGHDYWARLSSLLRRCLTDLDADPKARAELKKEHAALLAAAMVASFRSLLWQQFRYGPFDDDAWRVLGSLFLRATQENCADTPVAPFGDSEATVTVGGEYLKALVFHASSMNSLPPLEIGLAERFIAHFLPHLALESAPRLDSSHWVDAAGTAPPSRLVGAPQPTASMRFFAPSRALAVVREMRTRIRASQATPAEVNLGGQYSVANLLAVLDHLATCWSPRPPQRNHSRHRVRSRLTACTGLPALFALLSDSQAGQPYIAHWTVEDIGQGGMSVRLPLARDGRTQIGTLVGMQPAGNAGWMIGIVRRFSRATETEALAGIETIARTPSPVTATDGVMKTDLILLDPLRQDTPCRVLLGRHEWEPHTPVHLFESGRPWRLLPAEVLETGEDWLLGRCSVVALDPDGR